MVLLIPYKEINTAFDLKNNNMNTGIHTRNIFEGAFTLCTRFIRKSCPLYLYIGYTHIANPPLLFIIPDAYNMNCYFYFTHQQHNIYIIVNYITIP